MPHVFRIITVAALVLSCACGQTTPEPAAPETPASAPKVSAPVQDTAEPATPPYGKILEILPGKDDPADRRAHVEIFNPTDKPCLFTGYTLRWGDSSKQMPLGNVRIPAGNSRQRFLVVHPTDGDTESLSVENATLELEAECGP